MRLLTSHRARQSKGLIVRALVLLAVPACSSSKDADQVTTSCEYEMAGLHYCNEYRGAAGMNTGCAEGGGTPGTGCPDSDLAGTCDAGSYKSYFYGTGAISSAVASVCPGGKFEATGDSGTSSSSSSSPCTLVLSGAYESSIDCYAVLYANSTPNLQIWSQPDGKVFQFKLSEVKTTAPASYSDTETPDLKALGSVSPDYTDGKLWSVTQNWAGSPVDAGTFNVQIDKLNPYVNTTVYVVGTVDLTFEPTTSSGASGTVDAHIEMR
jgi:hypothetical protein